MEWSSKLVRIVVSYYRRMQKHWMNRIKDRKESDSAPNNLQVIKQSKRV